MRSPDPLVAVTTVDNLVDVLPQQIALLNPDGVIVAVNAAWRNFAVSNGVSPDALSEGVNYLQACAEAASQGDNIATKFAAGIRAVLSEKKHYSCEYPGATHEGSKLFLMHVAPATGSRTFVVTHTEISGGHYCDIPPIDQVAAASIAPALSTAEENARRADLRLQIALEAADLVSFEWDIERNEIRRFAPSSAVLPPLNGPFQCFEDICRLVHPEDREQFIAEVHAAMRSADGRFRTEVRFLHDDGRTGWISQSGFVEFEAGRPVRLIGLLQDISRRKQIESDLRESEALSRTIFESSPDCVKVIDADGRVIMISPSGLELLELDDASPILGHDFVSLWPEASQQMVGVALKKAWQGETTQFVGMRATAKGNLKCWDCLVSPMRGEEARVGQLLIVSRDVSAAKQVENALRESEATLLRAQRAARAGVWDVDMLTGNAIWSQPYYELFGLPPEIQPSQEAWLESVHPDDRARVEAEYARALKSGGIQRMEFRVLRQGQEKWIRSEGEIKLDESGRPLRLTGICYDVTERHTAQQALLESESRFRQLVQSLPQIVWSCEPDGKCDYLSPQWCDYTGVQPEQHLGYGWASQLHHEDRELALESWKAAVAAGDNFVGEYRIRRRDGEYRWFHTLAVPFKNEEGRIVKWFGSNTDVNELKRIEQALKEGDRRKDEFLAVLAHELRNPLAPIRSGLDVLQRSGHDPIIAARVHDMMARQVKHLVRLVDDLLEVARISGGKIELKRKRCNLIEVLRHALETSRPLIKAGNHRVIFDPPNSPVMIDADPVRLVQVFSNLLNNAAKYTPPRGTISIEVEQGPYNAIIWVRDNGKGITEDMLPKVFELFAQAEDLGEHDGLGVGLALVRTLVELHGGIVTASSKGTGMGSEFVVRLPLPQPESPARAELGLEPAGPRRVLVIDDDRDVADSLTMLLGLLGCNVMTAYSGAEGLTLVPDFQPSIVFLDIGMPDMNGFEVARHIRATPAGRNLKLIALTGWGQEADRARTRESGFDRHLVKPADIDALDEILSVDDPPPA